jgi:5-methylcytosine-specific restriction endonuclease McrA
LGYLSAYVLTVIRPMKISPLPPRSKPLKRSTTPIRKVNPVAKAKRVKKQKAFYSSAAWKKLRKEALERAGHCCEQKLLGQLGYDMRCEETMGLQVHHKTYARFGGKELPEDLQVLCKRHHEWTEIIDHPTRHPR